MAHSIKWSAVVLAGDRGEHDPVARAANSVCKSSAQLNGKPMLEFVLAALQNASAITDTTVCGPAPERFRAESSLLRLQERYAFRYIAPKAGPSASAIEAVRAGDTYPVLLLTCDLPLLQPASIDDFCSRSEHKNNDITGAYVPLQCIRDMVPNLRKTVYNNTGDSICFANLFAITSAQGLNALQFWSSIESQRKNPLKIVQLLGWKNIMHYKTGRFDFSRESDLISSRLGCRAQLIEMQDARVAIDVDSQEDYSLLSRYFGTQVQQ